jgi:hypothetical protein
MSNWLRKADDTLPINALSISFNEPNQSYLIPSPVYSEQYVVDVAGYKLGMGPRYILKRVLNKLEETYPEGVSAELIISKPIENPDIPIVRRLGCYVADQLRKERKKWLPAAPEPRGWEDGGGTTSEDAIKAINRPEENWERIEARRKNCKINLRSKLDLL